MSYTANRACGAYYEHAGSWPAPYAGLGQDIRQSFNAAQVWQDAQLGGEISRVQALFNSANCTTGGGWSGKPPGDAATCKALWSEQGKINAAGGRAARAVQAALNELGYGPLAVDGVWGGGTTAAWQKFCLDQNLPAGPGLVNQAGLMKMEQLLKGGATPGPQKAGMPSWAWLLLAGAAVAAVVVVAKKKKAPAQPPGKSLVPVR